MLIYDIGKEEVETTYVLQILHNEELSFIFRIKGEQFFFWQETN